MGKETGPNAGRVDQSKRELPLCNGCDGRHERIQEEKISHNLTSGSRSVLISKSTRIEQARVITESSRKSM